MASAIIEYCLQPRCLISPMDADFCAQFIKVIHTQGTPGFSTLMCYDKVGLGNPRPCCCLMRLTFSSQLLGDHVKVVIFSCSEYEARNYGKSNSSPIHEFC